MLVCYVCCPDFYREFSLFAVPPLFIWCYFQCFCLFVIGKFYVGCRYSIGIGNLGAHPGKFGFTLLGLEINLFALHLYFQLCIQFEGKRFIFLFFIDGNNLLHFFRKNVIGDVSILQDFFVCYCVLVQNISVCRFLWITDLCFGLFEFFSF